VKSIDATLEFYVRKLGFVYCRHLHATKVILSAGSFDFFVEEHAYDIAHPKFHFGIQTTVEGVYAWETLIRDQGIPQVVGPQPTGEARMYVTPDQLRHVFYFADPDGHIIEVYSHIGRDVGFVDPAWSACASS
jgi:catechol 2,3-dioxygenase-like lactoylglutathione lyase family enzyme